MKSLKDYYDSYCAGEDCRIALMLAIKLVARADTTKWCMKRHLKVSDDAIDEMADDTLIRVMKHVDKKHPDFRIRHEVFTIGRVIFRSYLAVLDKEKHEGDSIEDIADTRSWDSPILRPVDYVPAGTLWTPETMLTIARAARELGLTKRRIYQLVSWNEIDSVVYGGRRVITIAALRDYREKVAMNRKRRRKVCKIAED